MHGIKRWLVACVAVDRGHEAFGDPDSVVQDFRNRGQAVGCARRVGDDDIVFCKCLVVHPVNDCFVCVFAWSRDQNARRSVVEMGLAGLFGCEDTCAFHHYINVAPRQIGRVTDRCDADRATANVDAVFGRGDGRREAAMHGIKAQEVRVGFHWAKIVNRDDFDVCAT